MNKITADKNKPNMLPMQVYLFLSVILEMGTQLAVLHTCKASNNLLSFRDRWLRQAWNLEASCLFLKCQDGMADVCQQDEAYPGYCALTAGAGT